MSVFLPGYHLSPIPRGTLGELSKVREELEEALDALGQGAQVMALVELSDMVGAMSAFLARHPAPPAFQFRVPAPPITLAQLRPRLLDAQVLSPTSPVEAAQMHQVLLDARASVEAWLAAHHPTVSWPDLEAMAAITARAFASGRRTPAP